MNFLPNFKIDDWFKILVLLGTTLIICSIFIPVNFGKPVDFFLLGFGLLFLGLDTWYSKHYRFQELPATLVEPYVSFQVPVWKPTIIGIVFILLGITLIILAILSFFGHLNIYR